MLSLSVGLVDFIRPEQQFDNLDELKAQIDVQSAREVFQASNRIGKPRMEEILDYRETLTFPNRLSEQPVYQT